MALKGWLLRLLLPPKDWNATGEALGLGRIGFLEQGGLVGPALRQPFQLDQLPVLVAGFRPLLKLYRDGGVIGLI